MSNLDFKIGCFLERQQGNEEENTTFAELEIVAGGICLTEVYDRGAQTTRPTIRVSLFHLVDWLLWNRWRLIYEPEVSSEPNWVLSHQIGGAGGGFLWPNLTFSSDGETVHLLQRSDRQHERMVRYLNSADVLLPLDVFQNAVNRLVEQVLERLTAARVRGAHLEGLYKLVQAESTEPAAAALRRDEARLGLDPDEIDAKNVRALRERAAWIGEHATNEVLADARYDHADAALSWLKDRSVAPDLSIDIADLKRFADVLTAPSEHLPWVRGAALAAHLRDELGLGVDPIDIDELVHAPVSKIEVRDQNPLAAGFVAKKAPYTLGIALKRHSRNGRRFEVARMVADALLLPRGDSVLPVTERATARQKVQRAFAQELLCPVGGLEKMLALPNPNEADLDDAADHYGVSQWTVRTALVNQGLVSRDYLPQRVA